jgi:hypothetical protein
MLGLALLPTTIVAQRTLKDQLVGTWALVSFGRTLNFCRLGRGCGERAIMEQMA